MQPLDLRIYGCCTHTSCHEEVTTRANLILCHVNKLRRITQRARKIGDSIALIHSTQLTCRGSDGLNYDGYRTLILVVIGNGERYSLALLIYANDNKLSGQGTCSHTRSSDTKQIDILCQRSFLYNLKHKQWRPYDLIYIPNFFLTFYSTTMAVRRIESIGRTGSLVIIFTRSTHTP